MNNEQKAKLDKAWAEYQRVSGSAWAEYERIKAEIERTSKAAPMPEGE